ncbi:hypothetical protein PFISCL1PPCAC_21101, partial [Pristionchus fissidentatus]
KLSIVILETRTEWKQKIVFSLRKLFFVLSILPIDHVQLGAVHWTIFTDIRMDLYGTFKSITELVFLPDQTPEVGDHNAEQKLEYHRTLLAEWLPRLRATLRCLRVYTFLKVDAELDRVMRRCTKLKTIAIGKLHTYRDHPEFPSIQYVDLDGQSMAYSSDDIRLTKRIRTVFPSARVFRVVRHSIEVLKALLASIIVAGGVFDVYTDLYEISHLLHVLGDTLQSEVVEAHPEEKGAFVEMRCTNERFRTTIHFYNHRVKRYME